MSNPTDAWLEYLSDRRSYRLPVQRAHAAEYIPVSWVERQEGGRVPVVKDEFVVPDTDHETAEVQGLFADTDDTTYHDADVGQMRCRTHGDAPAHQRVDARPEMLSYVAVVGGTIKNRPTPEPADKTPQPASGTAEANTPLVVIVDTGLSASAAGHAEDPTDNRDDAWAGRFELAGGDLDNLDLLDVLEPEGLDIGAGHGTFVAGMIGRVTRARIVLIRAFDTDGIGSDAAIARAIRQAASLFDAESAGRGVLNLSCGIETPDNTEPRVLRAALDALPPDVVVVAAAGNESTGTPFWPAASKRALAVTALDEYRQPTGWANYGPWVDFATRGVDLVAPYVSGVETQGSGHDGDPFDVHPDTFAGPNPYAKWTGTSFAAAQVSGAAANLLLDQPDLSRAAVTRALQGQATGPLTREYGYPLQIL